MPMCQAFGCKNQPNRGIDTVKKSFFAIPDPVKDSDRCAKWLHNIGSVKFNIGTYVYHKNRVVCEDHFTPDCFQEDTMAKYMGYKSKKKFLKPGTVPTVFVHRQIQVGSADCDCTLACNSNGDRVKEVCETVSEDGNELPVPEQQWSLVDTSNQRGQTWTRCEVKMESMQDEETSACEEKVRMADCDSSLACNSNGDRVKEICEAVSEDEKELPNQPWSLVDTPNQHGQMWTRYEVKMESMQDEDTPTYEEKVAMQSGDNDALSMTRGDLIGSVTSPDSEGWYNDEDSWNHAPSDDDKSQVVTANHSECDSGEDTWIEIQSVDEDYKTQCDQCGKAFVSAQQLLIHKCIHNAEKPYECDQCGKAFIVRGSLSRHKRNHSGEKPHECDQCGKAFRDAHQLLIHKRIHTAEKPYECDQCGKAFNVRGSLSRHKLIHSGEKPYECDQCGKAFVLAHQLLIHKRIHTAEKPYECDQCGKAFIVRGSLSRHKLIHSGEKPYECDQCGKAFGRAYQLLRHKRIHTEEKTYECDQCGKAFREEHNLLCHKRIHTGEKPYECDQCGKAFKFASNLKVHIRTHTGEKPCKCDQCGKVYSDRSYLKKHKCYSHRCEGIINLIKL